MKSISLKEYGIGRYDDVSPFVMAENKINLKINLWSKSRVADAVEKKWITAEEFETIAGEPYAKED